MTSGSFPLDIVAAARISHARWDIPASVSLAQWALESAWGTAMPAGSNNPFGIKAIGTQPSVAATTREVVDGRTVTITAHFRAFPGMTDAFDAHAELLATNSHYAKARLVRHDAERFADALTGVYATDPRYGEKLIGLMRASNLYAFDAPLVAADASPATASPSSMPPPSPAAPPSWLDRLLTAFITFKKAA